MESLCKKFGTVSEFTEVGPTVGGLPGARVRVSNCNVKTIPYFIPLVDIRGVVYPIRILLVVSDCGEELDAGSSIFSGLEKTIMREDNLTQMWRQ